jgi:hypothetical protein
MSDSEPKKIVNTDRLDGGKLVVSYTDKTTSVYTTDQLASLTPETTMGDESSEVRE